MPLHPELNNFLVGVNIDDIISVVLRQSEYLSFAKKVSEKAERWPWCCCEEVVGGGGNHCNYVHYIQKRLLPGLLN